MYDSGIEKPPWMNSFLLEYRGHKLLIPYFLLLRQAPGGQFVAIDQQDGLFLFQADPPQPEMLSDFSTIKGKDLMASMGI